MGDSSEVSQEPIEENAALKRRLEQLERSEQELKRVSEALRKSEEKYRQLSESAYDQIMTMDLDGVIQYANRSARDLAAPITLVGLPMRAFLSPDQVERHEQLLQKRKDGDEEVYAFTWDLIHPTDGRRLIMDVRSSVMQENERPSGVLMIARNVTDQILRDEALRKSEARYRSVVENANEGIHIIQDGMIKFANPAAVRISGFSEQELLSKPFVEFFRPDDRAWLEQRHRSRTMGEDVESHYTYKAVYVDGRVKHFLVSSAMIEFEGRPATLSLISDVTAQESLNEALRLREGELRAMLNSADNGILAVDDTGRVILTNPRFMELWGIPKVLSETKNNDAFLSHAAMQVADPKTFREKIQLLHQSDAMTHDIILLKDGRLIERYSYPILSEGIIRGRVVSFRDVTDQKKAETALREREQLFKSVFSLSPVMMGIQRFGDGKFLQVNEAFIKQTGYQREEVIGHTAEELGLIEPDTREHLIKMFSEKKMPNYEEIQYKTRAGGRRHGFFSATFIGDEDEKKVLGIVYDITERKLAESLLKSRDEESLALAKNLEEANIALRVVLSRREEDQKILEEKIQANINDVILPFIRSVNRKDIGSRDSHYLDLLESNLLSILSPFIRNVSITYKNLTPREMQIAEMIRQGKNSKEIAEMLGTSVATVNTHRNNIRKKMNVKRQKTNLRSHLLSLS